MIEHIILQMEKESGMDREAALAKMRFTFIDKICKTAVVRPQESRERARSYWAKKRRPRDALRSHGGRAGGRAGRSASGASRSTRCSRENIRRFLLLL